MAKGEVNISLNFHGPFAMASFLSMFLSLSVLSRLPSTLSLPTAPSMGLRQADIDANADLASTPWILEDEYSGSNLIKCVCLARFRVGR